MSGLVGGGAPPSPTRTPDTLRSEDRVEVALGLGEGPIKGLVGIDISQEEAEKNVFIGDTPLRGTDGTLNFEEAVVEVRLGTAADAPLQLELGGQTSSEAVGTSLAQNVAVTRTVTNSNVDFLEIRLNFSSLFFQSDSGVFETVAEFKIEFFDPVSSTWSFPFNSDGTSTQSGQDDPGNPNDRRVRFNLATPPSKVSEVAVPLTVNFEDPDTQAIFYDFPTDIHLNNSGAWDAGSTLVAESTYYTFVDHDASTKRLYINLASRVFDPDVGEDGKWVVTYTAQANPTDARVGDLLLRQRAVDSTAETFFWNGDAWVKTTSTFPKSTYVDEAGNQITDATAPPAGHIRLKGKTSSTYAKELRFPVTPITSGDYQIRITRISKDTDTEYNLEVAWESYQMVVARPLLEYTDPDTLEVKTVENLAVTRLFAKASDQFSGVPTFSGVYDGLVVKIPSNFDPYTNTYDPAIWDGTFKLDWTNNQAWIIYDLVTNTRYGMSATLPEPITMNIYEVYEAGQHASFLIDGEPRYSFNQWITEPRSARELIHFIAGTMSAVFIDNRDGTATLKYDADRPGVALFTKENVIEGDFGYSYTDITERYNEITVTFVNPDLNWAEDRRIIQDLDHIAKFGRIPHSFAAPGCHTPAEAKRRARHKLATATTETEIVSLQTNRQGLYLDLYETILVADEDMGRAISGRIQFTKSDLDLMPDNEWLQALYKVVLQKAPDLTGFKTHLAELTAATETRSSLITEFLALPNAVSSEFPTANNSFSVRDPITLQTGVSYTIRFFTTGTDGYELFSTSLTNVTSGDTYVLETSDNLPTDLPENAVFAIEADGIVGLPKPYRVLSVVPSEGSEAIEITASEINTSKYAFVDGIAALDDPEYSVIGGEVLAPSNVTAHTYLKNGTLVLVLSWDPSPTIGIREYVVDLSVNGSTFVEQGRSLDTEIEIPNPPTGVLQFNVRAVDIFQKKSVPASLQYSIDGSVRGLNPVTNLILADEPFDTVFESLSPRFEWEDGLGDPVGGDFQIRVFDTDTGLAVRQEYTPNYFYIYTYRKNNDDHDGIPERSFTIEVSRRDPFGNLSDPVSLAVQNEAPAAPTPEIVASGPNLRVRVAPPAANDFGGMVVHVSETEDFTPVEIFEMFGDVDNTAYVTALYERVLNTTVDPAGLTFWTQHLDDGTQTRYQVAQAFATSSDQFTPTVGTTNTEFVEELYLHYLNKPADADGLAFWVGVLDTAAQTREQVHQSFASASHDATQNTALSAFTTQLYEGPNTQINETVDFPGGYYVRVALFDRFSRTELNYTAATGIYLGQLTGEADVTPPGQPTGWTAVVAANGQITFSGNVQADATHFILYEGETFETATAVARSAGSDPLINYIDLAIGPDFTFWIVAADAAANESIPTAAIPVARGFRLPPPLILDDLDQEIQDTLLQAKQLVDEVIVEKETREGEDTIIKADITTLDGRVGTTEGSISDILALNISPTSALLASITTLEADVGDNTAEIQDVIGLSLSPTTALITKLNTIDADVLNVDARVDDVIALDIDAGSALSTKITNFETDLDEGISGSVASELALLVGPNGASGKYELKLDVNGYISGYGLTSVNQIDGTPQSEFRVIADQFRIQAASGDPDDVPFYVQAADDTIDGVFVPRGVYVEQAFIRNASVGTLKIGNNAVTIPVFTEETNSINRSSATYQTVADLSIVLDQDSTVLIMGMVNWDLFVTNPTYNVAIYFDGTLLYTTPSQDSTVPINIQSSVFATAGTYNVEIKTQPVLGMGSGSSDVDGTLLALGVKR